MNTKDSPDQPLPISVYLVVKTFLVELRLADAQQASVLLNEHEKEAHGADSEEDDVEGSRWLASCEFCSLLEVNSSNFYGLLVEADTERDDKEEQGQQCSNNDLPSVLGLVEKHCDGKSNKNKKREYDGNPHHLLGEAVHKKGKDDGESDCHQDTQHQHIVRVEEDQSAVKIAVFADLLPQDRIGGHAKVAIVI